MAYYLSAPPNSFVQFTESNDITSCEFADINLCLPVYDDDDVNFQFIVSADTEDEARALCSLDNGAISVGLSNELSDTNFLLEFLQKPERFRISPKRVLFNWGYGLPDFKTVISRGECFNVKIVVNNSYVFYSNCFQRIAVSCHTSVIEYSNEDDYAGFNYCNSAVNDDDYLNGGTGPGLGERCFDPTIIPFNNVSSLSIPYTALLESKYGPLPSVKCWIYDTDNALVDMGVRVELTGFPVTNIYIDTGGISSGILIIR